MREPPQSERRRASASALRERAFKSRNILAGTRFLSIQFEGLRSGKSPPPNAVSDVRRANCPAAIGKAAAPAKNACPRPENFRLQIAGEISILVFLIMIPDVLAERYASKAMRQIWSAEGKILLERDLWIAVMKAQKELGLDIPQEAIDAYERVKGEIRIDEINRREKNHAPRREGEDRGVLRLAGYEHIHKGMTSRDLTECVEQLQCRRSLELVRTKAAAPSPCSRKRRALQGRNPRRAHAQRHSPADDFRQAARRIRGGLSARRGKYPVAAGLLPRARDKGRRRNPTRPADAL